MTEREVEELDQFADEWYNDVVLISNHSSQTLQHIAKEARIEIKQMSKEFSHNGFVVRNKTLFPVNDNEILQQITQLVPHQV